MFNLIRKNLYKIHKTRRFLKSNTLTDGLEIMSLTFRTVHFVSIFVFELNLTHVAWIGEALGLRVCGTFSEVTHM